MPEEMAEEREETGTEEKKVPPAGFFASVHWWRLLILGSLATVFFLGASSFNFLTQKSNFTKWFSPDETANYFFTKLYAETGSLSASEPLNPLVGEIIHPRSFRSDNGIIKPVSFLGLSLLYGKIAAVTGVKTIPYLTPLIAAIGIIFYYLLIKEIFGPSVGLLAASLLAFFPPYLYYSSRSMFHNVLFVVLVLIGLYFGVAMSRRDRITAVSSDNEADLKRKARIARLKNLLPRVLYPALSGAAFGFAIITRSSELLWLAPLLFFTWLSGLRKIGLQKLIIFLAFLVMATAPALYWNKILFGSPLSFGYPQMNSSINELGQTGTEIVKSSLDGQLTQLKTSLLKLKNTVFYFGFDYLKSLRVFYYYFFRMFAWLFWGAVLGLFLFFAQARKIRSRQMIFLACWLMISAILLFYYGSWEFHDNPDPKQTTIGNSYTRYWLPIYLGALPWLSLLVTRLTRLAKSDIFAAMSRLFLVGIIAIFSMLFTLFGSDEGLVPSVLKMRAARAEAEKILGATETNSVIITRYHDKLLFPERKVIVGLFDDDRMNLAYARLLDFAPVYYYNFTLPDKDVNYLNNTKLVGARLNLAKIFSATGDFTLYRLAKATSTPETALGRKAKAKK